MKTRTPPLLCVHGFLGAPADWDALAQALPVETWALPGHGSPQASSFGDAVQRLIARIRACPVPPHLVGYSMGGRLALAAALEPGVRLASLVILSASPGLETESARVARARADDRLADDLAARGLPRFVRDWYAQPLFASLQRRPALLNDLLTRRADGDADARAAALRALTVGRQPSLWPRLAALAPPALFIAGERDAKYRAELARAAGLCPRARLLTVPDSGHLPHLERPAFVQYHLQNWVGETLT